MPLDNPREKISSRKKVEQLTVKIEQSICAVDLNAGKIIMSPAKQNKRRRQNNERPLQFVEPYSDRRGNKEESKVELIQAEEAKP